MGAKKAVMYQIVRDSKNGQFLPKNKAIRRPATTETETISRKK
ncbi:MAG TPA: hypothetical protein VMB52_01620 [Verrucomicrobiae bacterium]|nr:hypothetical protein [Verrucomicrobiae bacterium]